MTTHVVLFTTVLLATVHWSTPATAQGRREWALSLGPQLGYAWAGHWLQGTVETPGQLTMVETDAKSAGMTLGISAALTKRFWRKRNDVAWGPIVSLAYANASNPRLTISATDQSEQPAMDDLAEQLHPRFMRFMLQAGLGLTLLGGLFEGRVLAGGELLSVSVPEFTSPSRENDAALAANLGVRLRLPIAERWLGYAGGNCGASKHPLATWYSTSCTGELGLEWVVSQ